MKNYLKMTLIVFSFLFLIAFAHNVRATHSYNLGYTDSFSYTEDLDGEHRGFSITYPRDKYGQDCGYYDWTYDGRRCKRTAYYDSHYVEYYGYNTKKDKDSYDKDAITKEAFKTYRESSKYKHQREMKEIEYKNTRYYGGYAYGYSGARYYRYGW